MPTSIRSLALLMAVALTAPAARADDLPKVTGANWAQAKKFSSAFVNQHVQVASIAPSFIGKTDEFWYAILTTEGTKYWRIDPAKKTKVALFDHAKLLAQLSEAEQKPLDATAFNLRNAKVADDGTKLTFTFDTTNYELDLGNNTLKKLGKATPPEQPLSREQIEKLTDEERQQYFERLRNRNEDKKDDDKKVDDKKVDDKKEDTKKDDDKKEDDKKEKVVDTKKGDEKKVDVKKEDTKKDDDKKDDQDVLKKDEKTDTGRKGGRKGANAGGDYKAPSPDKKKYLYVYKFNLYLAEEGKESEAKQLSTDGEEDYGYGGGQRSSRRSDGSVEKPQPPSDRKTRPQVNWSKDSKRFTVTRSDRRGLKDLFLVDSIAQPRPALETYSYSMPGEPAIAKGEIHVGDAEAKTLTKLKPKWKDESYTDIAFGKTSDDVEFIRRDRLRRNHEYCRLNAKTGEEKSLISEGFQAAYLEVQSPRIIEETDEIVWWSERSGWAHFYLYDRDGKLKNPVTTGDWRASRIVEVDAKNRLVYFLGNAREPGENVYYTHLYRVRTDGSDLTDLTPGNAMHRAWLSPTKRFVVDSFSRTDLAPAATLRDDKGGLVMELEKTDLTALKSTGWTAPECFNVKAADGVTDLYGNLWKPFDFNDKKKYPIIVYVYPGPQTEGVNHTFSAFSSYQQLAQLGFIVVQVGHRGGCPERSKAYHSYGYFNLRDYGLTDKKAALEALAGRHPWIDIDRVGIYGHSGGGFMSGAAMLQKPYNEFFKAAVASAGNHDNNIYNNYWSETYHGLREVVVDEKKDDAAKGKAGERTEGKGQGTRTGLRRKGPPDEPADDEKKGDAKTGDAKKADKAGEAIPPPREVKLAGKELETKLDELQKQIDESKKALTAALGQGESKKDEIAALFKKHEALLTQRDDLKKGEVKSTEKTRDTKVVETKKDEVKAVTPPKTKFDIKIPTNAELAENLKGHILLVHGEIDNNVHPANTMRLVDALIKANKRFELLIIPGARHGFGVAQPYFTDRMWDFFAEHLLNDRQTNADIKERDARK